MKYSQILRKLSKGAWEFFNFKKFGIEVTANGKLKTKQRLTKCIRTLKYCHLSKILQVA